MDGLDNRLKIVVVCGPTATGKTRLAVSLAGHFDGEMVCADSMQIYRGLSVGTAAITREEAKGIPQHLTSFLPPEESYSVANWVRDAKKSIDAIANNGKLPVLCGGTGLYIESLVKGVRFTEGKTDEALRSRLQKEWETQGGEKMLARLAKVDPDCAKKLHLNDKKRILRALELWELTGQSAGARAQASLPAQPPYRALCLGLDFPDREALYKRADARVDAMMESGLLAEAKMVWKNRERFHTAAQAIGYKEFFPYFDGETAEASLDGCVERLKQATRNYAKRQLTWFRRMEGVVWLNAAAPDLERKAVGLAQDFLEAE
ncbi:tRNA (adenosine(37)-N6)-dimethylallyltransferase MiaA [Clostridia bacterium OttesenSCG-928-O13]|nr:tRNA (adenosine(37)-N6)-dimethylallyltransferase MiaA [Clostridia bacterium OttesenSCG-928-O13]